jgi:hypothetical protein
MPDLCEDAFHEGDNPIEEPSPMKTIGKEYVTFPCKPNCHGHSQTSLSRGIDVVAFNCDNVVPIVAVCPSQFKGVHFVQQRPGAD